MWFVFCFQGHIMERFLLVKKAALSIKMDDVIRVVMCFGCTPPPCASTRKVRKVTVRPGPGP